MQIITDFLQQIGLTKNEINIYLTSLSLGQTTSSILWKKTGMTRSTARYTCQSLVNKNIMNCISKKDHFLYSAEKPEKIRRNLEKQSDKIQTTIQNFDSVLPELEKYINPFVQKTEIKYYQGVEWIKEIFLDVLNESKTLYGVIRLGDEIDPQIKQFMEWDYLEKRRASNFQTYAIFNDHPLIHKYMKTDDDVWRKTLLLPSKEFPFPWSCYIYWDKVAFFSIKKGDLNGVIIQNSNILETQTSFFKLARRIAQSYDKKN